MMRICRFGLASDAVEGPRLGLIDAAGMIRDVTGATGGLPDLRWPVPPGDHLVANLSRLRGPIEALARRAPAYARDEVALLSPVANPGKIVCATALDRPELSGKVVSTIAGEGDGFRLRGTARATRHEPALGIVIGHPCADLAEGAALDHVAGYCGVLDTSVDAGGALPPGASLEACVTLGPWLVTTDEIANPAGLAFRLSVNGEPRGAGAVLDSPFGVAQLVAFASSVMPLHPGDLLMVGPGRGVAARAGDLVGLEIEQLGRLEVPVLSSVTA